MHIILCNYICVPNKETIIVTATATNVTHVYSIFKSYELNIILYLM